MSIELRPCQAHDRQVERQADEGGDPDPRGEGAKQGPPVVAALADPQRNDERVASGPLPTASR